MYSFQLPVTKITLCIFLSFFAHLHEQSWWPAVSRYAYLQTRYMYSNMQCSIQNELPIQQACLMNYSDTQPQWLS